MRKLSGFIFSLNFLFFTLIAAQTAAIVFLCFYIPTLLPSALVYAGLWLTTAASALILYVRRGAAEVKCVWFVLIAALPAVGAVIYLMTTVKRKPCGILDIAGTEKGIAEAGYDRAEYFDCGAKFFDAVIYEIERARRSVYIEFFIVAKGEIFSRFTGAIASAKKNGAEVKLIFDGLGSAFRIRGRHIKALKKAGAEVKIFNRITPLPRARLNFRDHRKIVTVDGRVAFTGGVNLADEYANTVSPHGYWKDCGVAVYGGAAEVLEGMFLALFNGKYEMPQPAGGKFICTPYCDSPPHRAYFADACVCAINRADSRVHIMTPYFCVSEKIAAALQFAVLRGVDVKIILPHVPDKKYAFEISKAYASALHGVKFYEYTPGFMHAKCVICDNEAFIGSHNLDFRSTRYNLECGIKFGGEICGLAEKDFQGCLALSSPLREGKSSVPRRAYRFFLKLLSPLV